MDEARYCLRKCLHCCDDTEYDEAREQELRRPNDCRSVGLSICKTVLLVTLMLVLPITEIIVGTVLIRDCRVDDFIPVYLTSIGTITLVILGIWIFLAIYKEQLILPLMIIILFLGLLGILVSGSIAVFRKDGEWSPSRETDIYCHPTLYFTAFITLIIRHTTAWPVFFLIVTIFTNSLFMKCTEESKRDVCSTILVASLSTFSSVCISALPKYLKRWSHFR